MVVLGRHVPRLQFLEILLGNEPVLTPPETFYQRLLANDPEEATEQAEEFAKDRSLGEFFNEVAIPALVRAQADSDRGVMSSESRTTFKNAIEAMLENLSEEEHAGSVLERTVIAQPKQLCRIACVAGRNELDEAAAMLLANLLYLERGIQIGALLPAEALSTDAGHLALFKDASIVCLSLISTSSAARARYLVKRIRRRAPLARILVGFWGLQKPALSVEDTMRAASAQAIAFSLPDCVVAIDSMLTATEEAVRSV
jgi:hypothetical protein